jgi:periplasmic protein TonB
MTSRIPSKQFQRGAVSAKLLIVVAAVILAAIAAWWFTSRSPDTVAPATPAAPGAAPVGAEVAPTISPAVEELSVDQLYREARKALAEQRMVMPAGNNALEYYLAILEKDAANSGAKEALRELFPFASGTAEQEINLGNLDEATRIIAQLAKADPSNYTLTILRSKLEAKRKVAEREAQTAAATAAAAAAAARPGATPVTPPAATTASSTAPASASGTPPAAASAPASTPAPAPVVESRPAPPPTATPPPAAAAASGGESRDASALTAVAPNYPPQAARSRAEGWVEVEFTVTPEGQVTNARVIGSDPPRVFDREAVRAIERATYRPRLDNGTPVSATLRRRIEFKLDG